MTQVSYRSPITCVAAVAERAVWSPSPISADTEGSNLKRIHTHSDTPSMTQSPADGSSPQLGTVSELSSVASPSAIGDLDSLWTQIPQEAPSPTASIATSGERRSETSVAPSWDESIWSLGANEEVANPVFASVGVSDLQAEAAVVDDAQATDLWGGSAAIWGHPSSTSSNNTTILSQPTSGVGWLAPNVEAAVSQALLNADSKARTSGDAAEPQLEVVKRVVKERRPIGVSALVALVGVLVAAMLWTIIGSSTGSAPSPTLIRRPADNFSATSSPTVGGPTPVTTSAVSAAPDVSAPDAIVVDSVPALFDDGSDAAVDPGVAADVVIVPFEPDAGVAPDPAADGVALPSAGASSADGRSIQVVPDGSPLPNP